MTGRIAVGGITRTDGLVLIRVLGARPQPGLAAKTLSTLGNQGINLTCVTSFVDTDRRDNLCLALAEKDLDQALGLLQTIKEEIEAGAIEYQRRCCALSVYGPHFSERPAIAARVFEATAAAGVDVLAITSSFASVSFLVDESDAEVSVQRLREAFVVP
ncbi:MAG: ACT domain-containing protein [Candidatus Krumholzibacteriia bacterium]